MRLITLSLAVTLFLVACSSEEYMPRPTQTWGEVVVRVDSRPAQVVAGMNEFWVILNDTRGRRVHDAVVSLRGAGEDKW